MTWITYQDLTPTQRARVLRFFEETPACDLSASEFGGIETEEIQVRRQSGWDHWPSERDRGLPAEKVTHPIVHIPEIDGPPITIQPKTNFRALGDQLIAQLGEARVSVASIAPQKVVPVELVQRFFDAVIGNIGLVNSPGVDWPVLLADLKKYGVNVPERTD